MIRHKHVQIVVIACATLVLSYSGGAQVAATYTNHGAPAGIGTNIGMTFAVALGALAAFAFCGAVLYNVVQIGELVFGIAIGVILAAALVTGDVWGAHWLAVGLPLGIRAHDHWYSVLLPGSAAFLSWWITVSLGAGVVVAYLRGRATR